MALVGITVQHKGTPLAKPFSVELRIHRDSRTIAAGQDGFALRSFLQAGPVRGLAHAVFDVTFENETFRDCRVGTVDNAAGLDDAWRLRHESVLEFTYVSTSS